MSRSPLPPAFHITRWLPRGLVLGTAVIGGALSWQQDVLAQSGLPSLFRKSQPASGAKSADAVPEIRKLLADARVAASQKDYSTAIRMAERAEKLAATSPATVGTAPDCAPAQIATVLQQYRQARAGRDVRMSLDSSPKVSLPSKSDSKAIHPVVRPPAAAAERTASADSRPGGAVAPVEKMLAQRSRTELPSAKPLAVLTSESVARATARPEQKGATDFRPTSAARTNASTVEIRNRPEEPLAARSSFFSESLIRTTAPLKSAAAEPIDSARVARIPDEPLPPQDSVDAEIAAMDAGTLVASQAAASANPAIDTALRERLLKPLSGMRVRIQEPSLTASATVDTGIAAVADDDIAVLPTESVAAVESAPETEPVIAERLDGDVPVAEPDMQTPFATTELPSPEETAVASSGSQTLAPIYDVQTAQAVAEPEPAVEQVSDERPAQESSSPRTFHSSAVVRHLEWSPVAKPSAAPVAAPETAAIPPEPVERDMTLQFEETAAESEEPAGVEQAGFRGRDDWSPIDRGVTARRRSVEDDAAGPFVVFREPATEVPPAWEVAPPPPADSAAAVVGGLERKTGMPRDALRWFSAAGVLLGLLALSSLFPRRK